MCLSTRFFARSSECPRDQNRASSQKGKKKGCIDQDMLKIVSENRGCVLCYGEQEGGR